MRRRPGDPSGPAAQEAVETIRAIPAPFDVKVGGGAAEFVDQQAAIADSLPLAVALLVGLTMFVLWLMTGSIVLPIKAIIMNALTVGASLGILTLVFQDGRPAYRGSKRNGVESRDSGPYRASFHLQR